MAKLAMDERMATDPPVSERQRRAMFAAAEGRSNLGIPRAVGKEFVGDSMQGAGILFIAPDGDVLLLRRASSEANYPGYWNLPGGKVEQGELPERAAEREAVEEIGSAIGSGPKRLLDQRINDAGTVFHTYARPVADKFTPKLNAEHSGFAWAPLDQLPQPLHPGVAATLNDRLSMAGDMQPAEWDALRAGFAKWAREEEHELEHATDDARGKLNEKERAEAGRNHGKREEMPGHVFLEPEQRKYPVKDKTNGEWVYSRDLLLAAAREARMHGHEGLAKRADALRAEHFGGAHDEATITFDRASVREYDADGRLHVALTPISKANVCEYYGREIPQAEDLGLDPARKYRLLRHPDELRKAADTFNNLPLLRRHVPVSASNHQPNDVVGSTGTDAVFAYPYLMNSLVVWSKDDIDEVEADLKKELSSGYRYRADMTPGDYEGEPYDGIMRDIVGNHVAVVRAGRAGPDVVIGDSKETAMDKIVLTRKAAMVQGAITAYLRPKLAADAKLDFAPLLADVTAKNYPSKRPALIAGVAKLVGPKLAKDAKIDDLGTFLMAFDEDMPEEEAAKDADLPEPGGGKGKGPGGDKKAADRKARDEEREALKERLKEGKASAEDWKALDAMMGRDAERDEEDERPDPEKTNDKARDKKAHDEEKEKEKDKEDTKKAMDEAIAGERKRQQGVREAERFVRPWVGDFAIACDSAEDVYKSALETLGKSTKNIHPSAFKSILEMVPKPGSERQNAPVFAHDSAGIEGFSKRYPDAMKIRVGA